MKIYAHRGASGYAPENTMPAFKLADELKADGIELDVQLSADGEIIVFHDNTMQRTARFVKTGEPVTGAVSDYTLEEIRGMEAGSWLEEKWQGTPVPTLQEVLEWMQGNNICINIEIKTSSATYKPELVTKTIELVYEYGMAERTLFSSFHHSVLNQCRALAPQIPCGILYSCVFHKAEEYAGIVEAQALHPYHPSISAEAVAAAQAKGIIVNAWTPNSEEQIKSCFAKKVDGVITNFPDRARELWEAENK